MMKQEPMLKHFEAKVIDGKLMLIRSERANTGMLPCVFFEVCVTIGSEATGHIIEAKVFSEEKVFDRKSVKCDTLSQMESEAVRLKLWGLGWQDKKMMKAFNDKFVRRAKPARL